MLPIIPKPLEWPFGLEWENGPLRRLFFYLPFLGTATRIRRDINRQLRNRDRRVMALWDDYPSVRDLAIKCSPIIRRHFGWANDLFIPTDPFDILFFDYLGDLVMVEAEMDIKEELGVSEDIILIESAIQKLPYVRVLEWMQANRSVQRDPG